jgi:hypothetical protein
MTTRRVLIIAAIVVLVCCIGVVGLVVVTGGLGLAIGVNLTQPVGDAANAFMNHVRNDDYTKAFDMVVADQKASFGDNVDGMKALFAQYTWDKPRDWKFTNFNITNNVAQVDGTVTLKSGSTMNLVINLRQTGDQWKILGIEIKQ